MFVGCKIILGSGIGNKQSEIFTKAVHNAHGSIISRPKTFTSSEVVSLDIDITHIVVASRFSTVEQVCKSVHVEKLPLSVFIVHSTWISDSIKFNKRFPEGNYLVFNSTENKPHLLLDPVTSDLKFESSEKHPTLTSTHLSKQILSEIEFPIPTKEIYIFTSFESSQSNACLEYSPPPSSSSLSVPTAFDLPPLHPPDDSLFVERREHIRTLRSSSFRYQCLSPYLSQPPAPEVLPFIYYPHPVSPFTPLSSSTPFSSQSTLSNEKFVVAFDLYPKSSYHLLVMPRGGPLNTLEKIGDFPLTFIQDHNQYTIGGGSSSSDNGEVESRKPDPPSQAPSPVLTAHSLCLLEDLRHMFELGRQVARKIQEYDLQKHRKVHVPSSSSLDLSPSLLPIKIGFHAIPSLLPLHLHILSADMNSPCMKKKEHYNSFITPFFIDIERVESWILHILHSNTGPGPGVGTPQPHPPPMHINIDQIDLPETPSALPTPTPTIAHSISSAHGHSKKLNFEFSSSLPPFSSLQSYLKLPLACHRCGWGGDGMGGARNMKKLKTAREETCFSSKFSPLTFTALREHITNCCRIQR